MKNYVSPFQRTSLDRDRVFFIQMPSPHLPSGQYQEVATCRKIKRESMLVVNYETRQKSNVVCSYSALTLNFARCSLEKCESK